MTRLRPTHYLPMLLAAAFALRLITLGASPLLDTTEGRYAEIGKEMAVTGDFVQPTLEGLAFTAKPPLHFWLTALSFKALGYTEFAARLPGYVMTLISVGILFLLARAMHGMATAQRAALICATTIMWTVGSAGVLTDTTLAATVTGAMASFIQAQRAGTLRARKAWSHIFFISLGLGMLAKGPVALLLCVLAILIGSLLSRDRQWLRRLEWRVGPILFLCVSAPWYLLAESRHPGFLRYFFINENFLRYIRSDYGDQFGHGQNHPYGFIWILGAAAFLPWTPFMLWHGVRRAGAWRDRWKTIPPEMGWMGGWALSPLLFFTVARSANIPYVMPGLPALSYLCALQWGGLANPGHEAESRSARWICLAPVLAFCAALAAALPPLRMEYALSNADLWIGMALAAGLGIGALLRLRGAESGFFALSLVAPLFAAYYSVCLADEVALRRSTKSIAASIQGDGDLRDRNVLFYGEAPYSSEFYLPRRPQMLDSDRDALEARIQDGAPDVIVFRDSEVKKMPPATLKDLRKVADQGIYCVFADARPGV